MDKITWIKISRKSSISSLKNVILPETNFEIDLRWSGIMGVGSQKKPVLKSISNNVHCGIRLGGMGIALGSKLGSDLAECIV